MKKLLLFAALAFSAASASALDINVSVNGKQINAGDEVDSYAFDELLYQFGGTMKLLPEVMVTLSDNADMTVTVMNTTEDANETIQFCWPSGCKEAAPGANAVQSGMIPANTPTNLEIDAILSSIPSDKLTVSANIQIMPTGGSTFSAFVFSLNMIYDPAYVSGSVDGIDADEAAPVFYNLNGSQVASPDHGIFIKKQGNKVSKVIL